MKILNWIQKEVLIYQVYGIFAVPGTLIFCIWCKPNWSMLHDDSKLFFIFLNQCCMWLRMHKYIKDIFLVFSNMYSDILA